MIRESATDTAMMVRAMVCRARFFIIQFIEFCEGTRRFTREAGKYWIGRAVRRVRRSLIAERLLIGQFGVCSVFHIDLRKDGEDKATVRIMPGASRSSIRRLIVWAHRSEFAWDIPRRRRSARRGMLYERGRLRAPAWLASRRVAVEWRAALLDEPAQLPADAVTSVPWHSRL